MKYLKLSKRKVPKKRTYKIDSDSEKIIIDYMDRWDKHGRVNRNRFVELSKMVPYTAKQICQHWWNKLDPRLNTQTPFTRDEKEYIFEWVDVHLETSNKKISWKLLQMEMEEEFGMLRSRNDIKNIWYAKKRKLCRQAQNMSKPRIESFIMETFPPLS
ncbi:hypothetical protein C1645_835498 [Glomus cerebriforme]|uniref:HTH myb-type domain-containing protein n=1 Tax=Glomus cerebriforme TaxID=658196 RepID=A0A397S8R3_9GLOM|nr:hypothetical protein C1645_835498 [Glomus cerebriforme]